MSRFDSKTPRVDALEGLLKVFSAEQLLVIAQAACVVSGGDGYGSVTIRFEQGVPRFITTEVRNRMPKPGDNRMDDGA